MKTHARSILSFLLLFILSLSNLSAKKSPKIDPIRFTLTTNATYLSANEEFEIKITAKYSALSPNLVYVFEGANSFNLKLVTPEGFKQTGGTFFDFVGAELTTSKPSVTYTVKGKFTSDNKAGTFQLLRSHKNANVQSDFVQVATLVFSTVTNTTDSLGKAARIAVVDPPHVPYVTLSEFRSGQADSSNVIFLNEGLQSGIFRFDPANTTSADDEALILVTGTRRYIRDVTGPIKPEWFGAIPDDGNDDYTALQKMFNAVTIKGMHIYFSGREYHTSNALRLKNVGGSGEAVFNLIIEGRGQFVTSITGLTPGINGKDLMYLDEGFGNSRLNHILIKNIGFGANGANRCFYASQAIETKFENVFFYGGDDVCVKIGTSGQNESYSNYFSKCYFNGHTRTGGLNNGCLQLHGNRMTVVDQMESDGGKYSIEIKDSDKCIITNSKLEGAKKAAISFSGSYGGEHRVSNNTLNPYIGGDVNGQYNGELSGIEFLGSNPFCNISNNLILVPNFGTPNGSYIITVVSGTISPTPANLVTAPSGATGHVLQYNIPDNRIVLTTLSGTFIIGEELTQASTGAKFKLVSQPTNRHAGILFGASGGYSIVTGNTIRLNPQYGILNYTEGVMISNNFIEASNWGILSTGPSTVIGNQISVPGGVAVERAYWTTMQYGTNTILAGALANIQSPVTETNGDVNFKGAINTTGTPVYSDNAAAATGGLPVGGVYRTSTGELKVRY